MEKTYVDDRSVARRAVESPRLIQQIVRIVEENGRSRCPPQKSPRRLDGDEQEVVLEFEIDGAKYTLLRQKSAPPTEVSLSPREREIVRLVATGHPNKTIANILEISPWTVNTHIRRVFVKMNVNSRAEMVAYCINQGLINYCGTS